MAQENAVWAEMLKGVREAKNISLQNISTQLRFSVEQLRALEEGAFERLPPPMITRGLIRNYARLLEIDVEPMLATYRVYTHKHGTANLRIRTSVQQDALPASKSFFGTNLGWIIILVVLILGYRFWFGHSYMPPDPVTKNLAPTPLTSPVAAVTPLTTDASSPINPVPPTTTALPPPITTPAPTLVSPASASPPTRSTEKIVAASTYEVNQKDLELPTDNDKGFTVLQTLHFVATERCWVRVSTSSDKVLYEKTLEDGEAVTLEKELPLHVVVGNASGISLTLSGKPIDWGQNVRNNVARLTLE